MNYLQKLFLGAGTKVLLEAGYISEDMYLTDKGSRALQSILVETHNTKLVEMAKADIVELKAAAK